MKQVIDQIKEAIKGYEARGDMFRIPTIDRPDVKVKKTDMEPTGSALFQCEYKIDFDNGDRIHVDYVSKDKCCTFQVNPDRSVITVTCSDGSLNFSDGWDERV